MSVRTGVNEYNQPTSDINSGYVGEFKYFGFSEVPPHCLACDGSEVSRTTYPELFAAIGTTWGAGDGSTTFNLPDFTSVGAFLRSTGGNAAALGTEQGDAIREIAGTFGMRSFGSFTNPSPDHRLLFTSADMGATPFAFNNGVQGGIGAIVQGLYSEKGSQTGDFRASRVVPTAAENRPVNYAVNICIVYE